MSSSEAQDIKNRQLRALNELEKLCFRDYFYSVLRYAIQKDTPPPRIDFSINGKLFCRLLVDTVDADDCSESCEDEDREKQVLQFTLLTFCGQRELSVGPRYEREEDIDEEKFENCPVLSQTFDMILMDESAQSGMCYATCFEPVSKQALDKVFEVVKLAYDVVAARATQQNSVYATWDENLVERVCFQASHDLASAAYEIKDTSETTTQVEETDSEQLQQFKNELETLQIDQVDANQTVCSAQLQASIWQYNDRHNLTAVSRQYEALQKLEKIGTAKHVPFRGAAEDLQKQIYLGEYLVRMLLATCTNLRK